LTLTNDIISGEQKGFCPVSGCVDYTGLLLNIIENFGQNNHELYLVFLDYFNAYRLVDHQQLIQVIEALGFPQVIIDFLTNTLRELLYVVHTGYGPMQPITLVTGLKQGDPSSPVLFIIFIEALIRALKKIMQGISV